MRVFRGSSIIVIVNSRFLERPQKRSRGNQLTQSALEFCPIHCPNGRLGQDLGFGEFAFALELPEFLNRNLAAVGAKLGQTSSFPNGPQMWFPIGL